MTTVRLATRRPILSPVTTDGPGTRTSIYFQGCSIGCVGCQSQHLWPAAGGTAWDVGDVANEALRYGTPITILGGEPFDQPESLAKLLEALRIVAPERHIMVYSGYTYEQLRERMLTDPWVALAIVMIDLLVDGPFIYQADNPYVQWRGSRNQRPIDLASMRAAGNYDDLVILPWDRKQTITVFADGIMEMTSGLAAQFAPAMDGEILPARRCGQTDRSKED